MSILKTHLFNRVILPFVCVILLPVVILQFLFFEKVKSFDIVVIILTIIYYVSLIPIIILYGKYRDKKELKKKLETKEMENKVLQKNLKK